MSRLASGSFVTALFKLLMTWSGWAACTALENSGHILEGTSLSCNERRKSLTQPQTTWISMFNRQGMALLRRYFSWNEINRNEIRILTKHTF